MSGKSKIEIKYIQDPKKRGDTFYNRRRGLVKKAHELSVVCGVKISLICTDFEKTCFTFCNDPRLSIDHSSILGGLAKPISVTRFKEQDYPFKQINQNLKQKLVYGKVIGEHLGCLGGIRDEERGCRARKNYRMSEIAEFLGKRSMSHEGLGGGPSSSIHSSGSRNGSHCSNHTKEVVSDAAKNPEKRLKTENPKILISSKKSQNSPTSANKPPLKHPSLLPIHHIDPQKHPYPLSIGTLNFTQKLTPSNLEQFQIFNLTQILEELKQNPSLRDQLVQISPKVFETLQTFQTFIKKKLYSARSMLEWVILRNMIAAYFQNGHDIESLSNVRSIPVKEVLKVLEKIEELVIQKVNEVFMRVVFGKLRPARNFNFLAEVEKVSNYNTLLSFKKVHLRKTLITRMYAMNKIQRIKVFVDNFRKKEAQKGQLFSIPKISGDLKAKYLSLAIMLQDKVFGLTLKEILSMRPLSTIITSLTAQFSKKEAEKYAYILYKKTFTKSKMLRENFGKKVKSAGGSIKSDHLSSFINFVKDAQSCNGGDDDNASVLSDFSFKFTELGGQTFNVFEL